MLQIHLQPLYSAIEEDTGVSLHQRATWEAIQDPSVEAIINCAYTGDGKSYAVYGGYPNGGILGLYPTNELVRDQQRQIQHYPQAFES